MKDLLVKLAKGLISVLYALVGNLIAVILVVVSAAPSFYYCGSASRCCWLFCCWWDGNRLAKWLTGETK